MKTVAILPLKAMLAALAIGPVGSGARAEEPKPHSDLHWGKRDGGLQLAAVVDRDSGIAQFWIRNGESTPIPVNTYFLGYFDNVHVEVPDGPGSRNPGHAAGFVRFGIVHLDEHSDPGWRKLERAPGLRAYASVGPGKRDIQWLKPGETLFGGRSNAIATGPTFSGLLVPETSRPSFAVDLGDFIWPVEILRKDRLEIRIVQELSGSGMAEAVTLKSPPIMLEGAELRTMLERRAFQKRARAAAPSDRR